MILYGHVLTIPVMDLLLMLMGISSLIQGRTNTCLVTSLVIPSHADTVNTIPFWNRNDVWDLTMLRLC